jgi:hypothetical protein
MKQYKYPKTITVPVVHKLMPKHFIEDPKEDTIELIGTFIHHQVGSGARYSPWILPC